MRTQALSSTDETLVAASVTSLEKYDLYLDLLAKILTNNLFATEPDIEHENESQFINEFVRHYIKGPALSTLPLVRFKNLRACVLDVIRRGVPGDFIETGVWRGGVTIFMRAMLKAAGITEHTVWVADLFEGLPEPDPEKFPLEAKTHRGPVISKVYNNFAVGLEDVKNNFKAFDLLDDQVIFLKGWFKDTLPSAPIDRLAIMRLDGDYYESTMDGLANLYEKLSVGGYVIIDDYGEDSWTYCRKAVDDFRRERGIEEPLIRVDTKCYFWQKKR